MSTYKTKNPLGSAAVKDLYDNAENVDKFVNDRTKEELDDRLGVLRKTWHGMEMIFSRFIDYITGRGEQAVAAIGWQELGSWAVGLAVDNRQQIVYYNGSWYKYLGELEHFIAGDSPENDGGVWSAANPTGKWSNIGDSALRSNLGSSEGFKLVGQFQSVAMLSAHPGGDGERVLVIGYQVGSNLGGGEFHYDSSQSAVNNGVTVFNGWCRKNIAELSTWDAGLTPDDDTDASPGIQRLFDAAPDGCTIYIDGRHCITRPHYLRGKSNLKILPRNGGFLDGITLKDQFEFILVDGWEYYAPYPMATKGYPGGVISALNCPNIDIDSKLKIRGAKKRFHLDAVDVTLRREYGDSGIQLRNCPGARISGIDAKHFWAWSIYGSVGSHNTVASGNEVGDCAVQSGIAIWNGCNYCSAHDNKIIDARLYGLEIEVLKSVMVTHGKIIGASAKRNIISGAKWGVAAVQGVFTADITDNEIDNCFYGFNAVKNKDVPSGINFVKNIVRNALVYAHTSGSQNVHVHGNDFFRFIKPPYAVLNQYSVIVDLEVDPTQFRIFYSGNGNLTTTVQIRGQVYTIVSRTVVNDATYHYGESRYVILTVDRALASDVEVGDSLLHSTEFVDVTAHATSLMYQEDDQYLKNVTFSGNNLKGDFDVYDRFETEFADTETVAISSGGHKFIKSAVSTGATLYRFARSRAWANAIELMGSEHSEGMGFYLPVKSGGARNVKPRREIQRSRTVSIAAGATFPIEYFYDTTDRMVIGIDVTLTNVRAGSNIQLRIDGTSVYPTVFVASASNTPVASFQDRNMTAGLPGNANTGTGRHAIQLFTSDNSAICDGYTITLYLL
ncbi:right-handed parallel beta-helix repeat-containing protein [Klebsiella variicola]|uniref:right-handed parallel beta-helix repeat-containing protein n=1 Tax=Klebsiella variicola TaxID=244366 RepID=UPI0005CC032B|nr:right-handed parallel beta-helix repeat-containing protein [Klebsiella variicola]MBP5848408.1 right-handed parallel beta-helix repeat-containing protein [Klebsiella variicola]